MNIDKEFIKDLLLVLILIVLMALSIRDLNNWLDTSSSGSGFREGFLSTPAPQATKNNNLDRSSNTFQYIPMYQGGTTNAMNYSY